MKLGKLVSVHLIDLLMMEMVTVAQQDTSGMKINVNVS
jgi:hypothetical protein